MNRWEQSEFSLRKIKDRKDKMRTKIGRIKILHPLQKEKTVHSKIMLSKTFIGDFIYILYILSSLSCMYALRSKS